MFFPKMFQGVGWGRVGHVGVEWGGMGWGWGGSCRGGVGHVGVECHAGVGWVM